MSRKARILVMGLVVVAAAATTVGLVSTRRPGGGEELPPPPAMEGTILVAEDLFDGEPDAGIGWYEVRSDPKVRIERRDGVLRVRGVVSTTEFEPDGLRTKRFDISSFDVRARVKLESAEGTGTKIACLEARSADGDSLRIYLRIIKVRGTDPDTGEAVAASGNFAVQPNGGLAEYSPDYDDIDLHWRTMRITYDASSGTARAFVDWTLIGSFKLKMPNPAFSVFFESPAEDDAFNVAFDDFRLYGTAAE